MPSPIVDLENEIRKKGHSEEFLKDVLAYAEHLHARGYPIIFSRKHLAQIWGITYSEISILINSRESQYIYYAIKKRSGGKRPIMSPHKGLLTSQKWINKNILQKVPLDDSCKGFRKGFSIKDNAAVHVSQPFVLKIDLFRFFETINERRVFGVFKSLGYHPNLAFDLAKICTASLIPNNYKGSVSSEKAARIHFFWKDLNEGYELNYKGLEPVLPQGAPTSPMLSNIIGTKLDKRLNGFAKKNQINYSRYADDITFSGNYENLPKISFIRKIIEDEGFRINESKTRLLNSGNRQIVTGLVVNDGVKLPKKFKKEIFRHLHFLKRFGPEAHLRKVAPDKNIVSFKWWLEGKIQYVKSVEPKTWEKMYNIFKNEIKWPA